MFETILKIFLIVALVGEIYVLINHTYFRQLYNDLEDFNKKDGKLDILYFAENYDLNYIQYTSYYNIGFYILLFIGLFSNVGIIFWALMWTPTLVNKKSFFIVTKLFKIMLLITAILFTLYEVELSFIKIITDLL